MEKNILFIAFLVGFFGDLVLQFLSNRGLGGPTGAGLNDYFKQHGNIESLFIAGGMMVLFYGILNVFKSPLKNEMKTYAFIALYAIILDLIFREFMIFPSLKGYYSYLNYFWSGFWQVFSMFLVLFIYFN